MSVISAAVCPMTPLIFRHLSGVADPLAELRDAAVQGVVDATAGADEVVVLAPVGGREAPGDWRDPSHSGPVHGEPRSLAEQVGRHLLALAGCTLPTTYVEVPGLVAVPRDTSVALLVMGDGAAARRDGAPGYIDDRSFGYDDHVASLLESGDGAGLTELDEELGAELMATGRLSFPVLGNLMPRADAELRWRGDPLGLTYFVALWRAPRGSAPPSSV
jgi:hypothetical protein